MSLAEFDQTSVVVHNILIYRIIQVVPFERVDCIRALVTVVVKSAEREWFGTEHLLACMDEWDALAGHVDGSSKVVHADMIFHTGIRTGHGQAVEEGHIVMAGSIVDSLSRALAPGRASHKRVSDSGSMAALVRQITGFMIVGDRAAERVTDRVREECKARDIGRVRLGCHGITFFCQLCGHGPAFTVEDHIRVRFMYFFHTLFDRFCVDQTN